jgi:hypothetical protein
MGQPMVKKSVCVGIFFCLGFLLAQPGQSADLAPINLVSSGPVDFRKFIEAKFVEDVLRDVK